MNAVDSVSQAYRAREDVVREFFEANASQLSELCLLLARRFSRGGRLIAFGAGSAVTDAQHVSVEFVHPVIVGKRALPALALPNDITSTLSLALGDAVGFLARQIEITGTPEDIALGMVHARTEAGVEAVSGGLKQGGSMGMLTISLGDSGAPDAAEHVFSVPSQDPFVVQEVHETLYHMLWELVHVFFEHKGLLADRVPGKAHDTGRSAFLYPFLAEAETDQAGVLREVEGSIRSKTEDIIRMRASSCEPSELAETAGVVAERLAAGGKVLVFGNGGSATDAQDLVGDLVAPPAGLSPVPAISLTNDAAVVTAVGNDVGFDNVYARQVIAYGREADVAVAISTSGGSRNVLAAVQEATRRGLLTVGLSGYGGGRQAELCARAHTIDGDYIPRLQEAQATQYHVLRELLEVAPTR
jgi:D-sedoheptulose 7-phosphate isomerase